MKIKEVAASLYPWDLADQTAETCVDNLVEHSNVNSVYLVGVMHKEKRPLTSLFYTLDPVRKYYLPENSRVYYNVDMNDFNDTKSFATHSRGYDAKDKMAWRRENVDMVIQMLRNTIKSVKPYVKFGISPYAVWRNLREDPRGSDTKSYGYTNYDISNYFTKTSTLRLGAEFRVTPQFSVRAGYSYVTSPVKSRVADNMETVYTTGTRPQYVVDKSTNYVTCGLGYRYQKFYIDAAYVWKHRTSDYHAYTPDPANPNIPSPQATITDSNSQIVLSMGFKF